MRIRWLLVFAALPLLAGCGGGASSGGASAEHAHAHLLPTDSKPYVLDLADLGVGWVSDLGNTRAVGLDESMKGDAPALKRLERKVYRDGYRAVFDTGSRVAIYSTAFTYASPRDARTVAAGWQRSTPKVIQDARQLASPTPALGPGESIWTGTVNGLPVYLMQWVHGNILAGVFADGAGATRAETVRLAQKQEARIEGRPDPASPLPGEAAKPPSQILADATLAVRSASGAHLVEDVDGQRLDFHASSAGGYGTIARADGTVRVRRVGKRVWTNVDKRFVAHSASAAAEAGLAGHWIVIPSTTPGFAATSALTTMQFIAGMLRRAPGTTAFAPTTLGTVDVGGRLAVIVALQNHGGSREAVYVPVHGTPYPLEVDQPAEKGSGIGRLLLDDWNVPFRIVPPAHALGPARICGCVS